MSAAAKRTFLFRTFHPIGQHVCAASGMVDASPEVNLAEFDATQGALDAVPNAVLARVMERAQWVTDVLGSTDWGGILDLDGQLTDNPQWICPDCGVNYAVLTLQEILVKFYLAMRLEEFDVQLVR